MLTRYPVIWVRLECGRRWRRRQNASVCWLRWIVDYFDSGYFFACTLPVCCAFRCHLCSNPAPTAHALRSMSTFAQPNWIQWLLQCSGCCGIVRKVFESRCIESSTIASAAVAAALLICFYLNKPIKWILLRNTFLRFVVWESVVIVPQRTASVVKFNQRNTIGFFSLGVHIVSAFIQWMYSHVRWIYCIDMECDMECVVAYTHSMTALYKWWNVHWEQHRIPYNCIVGAFGICDLWRAQITFNWQSTLKFFQLRECHGFSLAAYIFDGREFELQHVKLWIQAPPLHCHRLSTHWRRRQRVLKLTEYKFHAIWLRVRMKPENCARRRSEVDENAENGILYFFSLFIFGMQISVGAINSLH